MLPPFTDVEDLPGSLGALRDRVKGSRIAEPALHDELWNTLRLGQQGGVRAACLVGPPHTGKTTAALAVATAAPNARYAAASKVCKDVDGATNQIDVLDTKPRLGQSVVVVDDCHLASTALDRFLDDLSLPTRQASVLFVTRTCRGDLARFCEDEGIEQIKLDPAGMPERLVDVYLQQQGFNLGVEAVGKARASVLEKLPPDNLYVVDWYLDDWATVTAGQSEPARLEALVDVTEENLRDRFVAKLFRGTRYELTLDDKAVMECLLPLAAIHETADVQVRWQGLELDPEHIGGLVDAGLLDATDHNVTVRLNMDPAGATLLLDEAADGRLLGHGGDSRAEFQRTWLEELAPSASVSTLSHLVNAALAERNDNLAAGLLGASGLSRRLEDQTVATDPDVLGLITEMPRLGLHDETVDAVRAVGERATQLVDEQPRAALALLDRLAAWQADTQPHAGEDLKEVAAGTAGDLVGALLDRDGLAADLWGDNPRPSRVVHDLEVLLRAATGHPRGPQQAQAQLAALLDEQVVEDLQAAFEEIGLRTYLRLVASARRAADARYAAADLVNGLVPDMEPLASRLRPSSLNRLREALRALPPEHHDGLWRAFSDEDLQSILDRSSTHQLVRLLQALQERPLARADSQRHARRLLSRDLRAVFGQENHGNIGSISSCFVEALQGRTHDRPGFVPDMVDHMVTQLTGCDASAMMQREAEVEERIARLSLLIRAVCEASRRSDSSAAATLVCHLAQDPNFQITDHLPQGDATGTTKGLGHLASWSLSSDEECARQFLEPIGIDAWVTAITTDKSPDQRFWKLWNLLLLDEDKARRAAEDYLVHEALPDTLEAEGLLVWLGQARGRPAVGRGTVRLPRGHTRRILALHALAAQSRLHVLKNLEALLGGLRVDVQNAPLSETNRQLQQEMLDQLP